MPVSSLGLHPKCSGMFRPALETDEAPCSSPRFLQGGYVRNFVHVGDSSLSGSSLGLLPGISRSMCFHLERAEIMGRSPRLLQGSYPRNFLYGGGRSMPSSSLDSSPHLPESFGLLWRQLISRVAPTDPPTKQFFLAVFLLWRRFFTC